MEGENRNRTTDQPEGSLLLRYIRGVVTDQERLLVENWINADVENEKILSQLASIYYVNQSAERMKTRDTLSAYKKVERLINKRVRLYWLKRVSIVAACFVGLFIMSAVITSVRERGSRQESQVITIHANAGMQARFDLPDGTTTYLNSGSTLSYPIPYDKNERRVILSGEGYFKVAHNDRQPFIVSTKNNRFHVRVVGTEFNMQAYENENMITTTLVNGLVNVEVKDRKGSIRKERLSPSEKAIYDLKDGKMRIEKVNTIYETDWVEGKLMFKESPLPDVLRKLSYYYNVDFIIQDPVIEGYCFTGMFKNRQLSQVLDYLRITSKMDYHIEEPKTDDSNGVKRSRVILWKRK